ncbi:MAG TPA: type I restriction enzyme HsdR N-terminal domain-containing protein [Prolixibacteraceae bacterium]|nr:type I restriction enzyme HsdR N-terminal domain-containing protein [Prolixibacteraceae bacterium]HRV89893.1 type I restriction enzyme HsdR N-terminal domain-containing protein [Prolixibacteraceae bacterium]
MQNLQLPEYTFRTKDHGGDRWIYDVHRRRWVRLTPEEGVRQRFLRFLERERGFPVPLMAVERKVEVNGLPQRFDLLVYDRKGNPLLVGEFKAPGVAITQEAFNQALRYNSVLKAPYFLVSNGLTHFMCRIDFEIHKAEYLVQIPEFAEMTGDSPRPDGKPAL